MNNQKIAVLPVRPRANLIVGDRSGADRFGRKRMLISSAGRRVGLMRCFRQAAGELGLDLAIYACDTQPEWSAACVEADRAFVVPPAVSERFVGAMLDICERNRIALVVPTIDTELIAYAGAADRFEAIGTHVAVSSPSVINMARDKIETARFLERAGVPTPRTAAAEDLMPAEGTDWRWPLLAKPRHGSSSRGIALIESAADLRPLIIKEPYLVQERLIGQEFTVNAYFDLHGVLRCAIPHERRRVRAGEVEKGVTVRHPALCSIAHDIAGELDQPRGALCFQAIVDADGRAWVFEINARFGGGYPLAHHAGAPFARWMLEERFGLPMTASDDWRSSVVMLRYDDAVFV